MILSPVCSICGENQVVYHRIYNPPVKNDIKLFSDSWHRYKECMIFIFSNRYSLKYSSSPYKLSELLQKEQKEIVLLNKKDTSFFVCDDDECLESMLVLDDIEHSRVLLHLIRTKDQGEVVE